MNQEEKIQKIILDTAEAFDKVKDNKLVCLLQEAIGNLAIFRKSIIGYSYTLVNWDSIKSNVTLDNPTFLMLTIRSCIIFGFKEVNPEDYNLDLQGILTTVEKEERSLQTEDEIELCPICKEELAYPDYCSNCGDI